MFTSLNLGRLLLGFLTECYISLQPKVSNGAKQKGSAKRKIRFSLQPGEGEDDEDEDTFGSAGDEGMSMPPSKRARVVIYCSFLFMLIQLFLNCFLFAVTRKLVKCRSRCWIRRFAANG